MNGLKHIILLVCFLSLASLGIGQVNPPPDHFACFGDSVWFIASQPDSTSSFYWDFGDNASDSGSAVRHLYGQNGFFQVTLTVITAQLCASTTTLTVLVDGPVIDSIKTINSTCTNSPDGSATVYASGGKPPLQYLWSNGQTNQTATNLTPGTYTITVTDSNGCSATSQITISGAPSIVVDAGACQYVYKGYGPQACASLTGSVISGGVPPYAYSWSNGETTSSTTVCPDSTTYYYFTVTDANGCIGFDSVIVHVLDISCSPMIGPATLSGGDCKGCDALMSVTFNGCSNCVTVSSCKDLSNVVLLMCDGTTYKYDNLNQGKTGTFCSPSGQNILTVWLKSGCYQSGDGPGYGRRFDGPCTSPACDPNTKFVSMCFDEQTQCVDSASVQQKLNLGWVLGPCGLVNPCTGLPFSSGMVNRSREMSIEMAIQPVTCLGNDGRASVRISGGTPPYKVNWSNGSTGLATYNLLPGLNQVTITDASGSIKNQSFKIGHEKALKVIANADRVVFPNVPDWNCTDLELKVKNGTSPINIFWDNGAQGPAIEVCPENPSYYIATAIDANGCVGQDTVFVNVLKKEVQGIPGLILMCDKNGNSHQVPKADFNYKLALGWTVGRCESENEGMANHLDLNQAGGVFKVYPNPFATTATIEFYMPYEDEVKLNVYYLNGQKVREIFHGKVKAWEQKVFPFYRTGLSDGVYIARLISRKGFRYTYKLVITD